MFTVGGKFICEYIWIGGNNELRSKTRVVEGSEGLKEWNYDASSTGQASSDGNTEGILRPVAYFLDPLRKGSLYKQIIDTEQKNYLEKN